MRKRIITQTQQEITPSGTNWLNLEELTVVEVSSEDAAYPIESALLNNRTLGWRAAEPGKQVIRLLFDSPQPINRIFLRFVDTSTARTQEFVLSWSADGGKSFSEIVRQQWNFNPQSATKETEDFNVDLPAVTALELSVTPDISGGHALASLLQLRLA
ncbi:MAG: discoidin domain-containing protein [Methylotenera sp.]